MANLEEIMQRNATLRAERRAKMPHCVEIEAAFKEVFGEDVRVVFAEENGIVIGKPIPHGVIPAVELERVDVRKAKRRKSQ